MDNIKKLVERMEKETIKIKEDYQIAIMCNSRSKTRKINGQILEFSDTNEFFSDQEFCEIKEGIQNAGFFVHSFFNELTLMQEFLKESIYQNNKIVYNLSRNGKHVGKKSLIPAFLDLMNIPYTGSNALVTSLCREKYTYTKYLQAHGIFVPKSYLYLGKGRWLNNEKPTFNTKVIIKLMQESASIGLSQDSIMIINKENIKHIENSYFNTNKYILIQEFIEGYECEVPLFVTENKEIFTMSPVGISINKSENLKSSILTYEHSCKDDYEFYELHTEIGAENCFYLQENAKKVAELMGITNYGRIDFRIDYSGIPYLIDIAASPYTTNHSSFAFSFKSLNINYKNIYSTIIGIAYLNTKLN
ncbi:D-alanine--D-alanine ligase family protein [Paenibacillus wulumuqiensis]|uniref:hypothetical protein n=1 Tax=Paenibacillus wulumuqiensis TaxID=1567107 RepID=UPI0006981B9B|nr:hypothetical protein [Paenibacillus wulumuqiensis]